MSAHSVHLPQKPDTTLQDMPASLFTNGFLVQDPESNKPAEDVRLIYWGNLLVRHLDVLEGPLAKFVADALGWSRIAWSLSITHLLLSPWACAAASLLVPDKAAESGQEAVLGSSSGLAAQYVDASADFLQAQASDACSDRRGAVLCGSSESLEMYPVLPGNARGGAKPCGHASVWIVFRSRTVLVNYDIIHRAPTSSV